MSNTVDLSQCATVCGNCCDLIGLKNFWQKFRESNVYTKEITKDFDETEIMIPKEESKEVKSEREQNVVLTVEGNVKENNKEENIDVIEVIEDQPNMISTIKIDSDVMKERSEKTEKNEVDGNEEIEKGGDFEQKPSDSNKSENSKSSTKIEIDATKNCETKESTKSKKIQQKIKQFFLKWRPCWLFLFFIAILALFFWIFGILDIDVKSGGIGGTSTHFFGSGSGGTKDEFGNSDENKETGKK